MSRWKRNGDGHIHHRLSINRRYDGYGSVGDVLVMSSPKEGDITVWIEVQGGFNFCLPPLTPMEARALGMLLCDAADEVEAVTIPVETIK